MSPDPSQVLPKIVSMQAVAKDLESGISAELRYNQTLNSHLCDSSFNQLQIQRSNRVINGSATNEASEETIKVQPSAESGLLRAVNTSSIQQVSLP